MKKEKVTKKKTAIKAGKRANNSSKKIGFKAGVKQV